MHATSAMGCEAEEARHQDCAERAQGGHSCGRETRDAEPKPGWFERLDRRKRRRPQADKPKSEGE